MPGYNHPGGLPPRPPTPEEIEAAQKKVVSADKRNAERLANVAIQNTKKALKVPGHKLPSAPTPQPQKFVAPQKPASAKPAAAAPPPAAKPAQPAPAQMGDLPKDEGEEEVFTEDDEKTLLGEGETESGDTDLEGDGNV